MMDDMGNVCVADETGNGVMISDSIIIISLSYCRTTVLYH
jgi:hypothetical protein